MGTCGHQLSNEKLPSTVQPQPCDRTVWERSDDGRCILHTTEQVETIDDLQVAIADADRIDGLQFSRQTPPNGFKFEDMALFGANFQNADLTKCKFRDTVIYESRFEGAVLTDTYFGPVKNSEDDSGNDESRVDSEDNECQGVIHTRTNVKSNNFTGANLSEATFREVNLMESIFECESMRSVSFIDCSLSELTFEKLNLRDADFCYSILRKAVFKGCDLHNATFHAAQLQQTRFENSTLQNADLRNAILDQTEFDNIRIDQWTQFDSYLVQEYLADRYSEGEYNKNEISDTKEYLHQRRDEIPIQFSEKLATEGKFQALWNSVNRLLARRPSKVDEPDYDHLKHARYRYRDLSRIFRSNGEPEKARDYSIREKNAKRKNALRNDTSSWTWLAMTRWTMAYGEKPTQPLKAAGAIIILSSFIYPFFGAVQEESGRIIKYCLDCQPEGWAMVQHAISIVYLSTVRFFTPTNPDIAPMGPGIFLGLFQTILGAILIAMFVFTLGRRATE